MTPLSRFTIFHSSLPVEGLVVENPVGWDTVVLSLVRHKDYQSLFQYFKGNFMWFGLAMRTLKTIEKNFGPNAIVRLEIDISFKTSVFINLYEGKFELSQLEEILIAEKEHYKMTVPIVQDDFITKFLNRVESQVDLQATVDLDGNARTAVPKIVLPMPSQKIRDQFIKKIDYNEDDRTGQPFFEDKFEKSDDYSGSTGPHDRTVYFVFSTEQVVVDEVKDRPSYGVQLSSEDPTDVKKYFVRAKYKGNYVTTGDIKMFFRVFLGDVDYDIQFYYAVRKSGVLTVTDIGNNLTGSLNTGDKVDAFFGSIVGDDSQILNQNDDLEAGDEIYVYGKARLNGNYGRVFFGFDYNKYTADFGCDFTDPSNPTNLGWDPVYSELQVVSDTTYPQTTTDAYLIKDAAESIVSKLVGQNSAVKSDYLATCKGRNAIFRGKHVRGYDFATKQFSMSFDEWWKGADPLLFLGLGYTEVAGVKKIEIENRAYFYDKLPVVNISNVNNLVRRYDLEKIYKSIEIGYKKGVGSESESGIDDPQTKRFYNTDFSSFGVKETVLCEWMAASLAIERSRRNRIELSKDDRNDEEIMVVAVTPDGLNWLPEFGTAFNLVTNLLNPDFRINIRHSATRLFKRAQAWFNGCMLYSDTGVFTFNRGEGNYEMTSQLEDTDCEAVPGTEPIIDEGADIDADTNDILFVPRIYEAQNVPMSFETYRTIVANKNKALGISRTDTGHVPMHIIDLGYELFKSKCPTILLLQATEDEL